MSSPLVASPLASSSLRILIVDDLYENIKLLTQMLNMAGYNAIEGVTVSALALKRTQEFGPDLIILDLMMSGVDGYSILRDLRQSISEEEYLPVLVITADHNESARERALALGATDFLARPHQVFDVTLRVRNLLDARGRYLKCMERNRALEIEVRERTQHLEESTRHLEESQIELKLAEQDVLERLALVGEHHDDDSGMHIQRVAHTSFLLAQGLGLPFETAYTLHLAAPLHDVGKIGISDTLLLKQGRLTPEEFEKMKTHCEVGSQLLAGGLSELLRVARQIAFCHHEHWDGNGYPLGLADEAIPLAARIVAVADVFDALTHQRPYKVAWPVAAAVDEIKHQSGTQFDPQVVEAFLKLDHASLIHPVLNPPHQRE